MSKIQGVKALTRGPRGHKELKGYFGEDILKPIFCQTHLFEHMTLRKVQWAQITPGISFGRSSKTNVLPDPSSEDSKNETNAKLLVESPGEESTGARELEGYVYGSLGQYADRPTLPEILRTKP